MISENTPTYFTVAQLIEELQRLPSDLPVLISGYESGFENFYQPVILELQHEPDNFYYDGAFQKADTPSTENFEAVVLIRELRDD
jgi:hypothetical protein